VSVFSFPAPQNIKPGKEVMPMPSMRGSRENVETSATLRHGYISAYDQKKHRARVYFPEKDGLVSYWFPVLVPNSLKNKDEMPLDKGEHVVCLCFGNGLEAGVILGSIWDEKNQPPIGNKDIRVTTFEDGTRIFVDRKKHIVEVKDSHDSRIRMEDKNIYIQAAPEGKVFIYPAPEVPLEPFVFPEPESPPGSG